MTPSKRNVTGVEYVEQISANASDRVTRLTFQNLAVSLVPSGGAVFDFGAGPGIDARFYAERGLTVAAYDVDQEMCDYFAGYCRELMQSGRIFLDRGPYCDFMMRDRVSGIRDFDLITSDFAPLNLIENLQELFRKFHALTAPHGRVLASVLSPYFVGDMKYLWWWRNVLRLIRDGHYFVPGSQARIFRRRIDDFAEQAAPFFRLERVFCGLPVHGTLVAKSSVAGGGAIRASWLASRARFMFLLFQRH